MFASPPLDLGRVLLAAGLPERDASEHRVPGQLAGRLVVPNRVPACRAPALRLQREGGLQAATDRRGESGAGGGGEGMLEKASALVCVVEKEIGREREGFNRARDQARQV